MRNGVKYKNTEEIAEEYGYCVEYVRRLIAKGKRKQPGGLKGVRLGRRWYVSADICERVLLTDNTETADEQANESNIKDRDEDTLNDI